MKGNGSLSVDEWTVEPALNRISSGDEVHYLRPQVMELLLYLARHRGDVVSTEELLEKLWAGKVVSHGTVYNCVAELRQALRNGHAQAPEIQSIPKKGYRLLADVKGIDTALHSRQTASGTTGLTSRRLRLASLLAALSVAIAASYLLLQPAHLGVSNAEQLSRSTILFPPVPSAFPLISDGARLYFNDWISGRLGLRQMHVSGGEAARMDSPFEDGEILVNPHAMTPDGAGLLIGAFDPELATQPTLWIWPLLNGAPRRIGQAVSASYSPDGSTMTFTDAGGRIAIADSNMRNQKILATLPGRPFWPVFSPDGQHIRFSLSRRDALPNSIWEISLDGGEPRRLFPDWNARSHCCGSWTPDGKHFVFQAIDEGRSQIWAASEPLGRLGRGPYRMTTGPIDFRRPVVANDGARLFAVGWQLRGELVRFDEATGSFVALPELDSLSAEWLAYSDNRLAYVTYPDASLWVANHDGSEAVQLSFPPLRALNPAWSPDGRRIAFEAIVPGIGKRIFVASLDTHRSEALMAGTARQVSPTWSPDGERIAFSEQGKEAIQVFDVATAETSELAGTNGMYAARWSPDGRVIAALSRDGIVLYDVHSESQRLLASDIAVERLYWSKDGEHLFFYEPFWRADARALYRLSVASGQLEQVTTLGGVRSTYGIGGMWVGRGPDDEPLLLRDLSIHHIYALELSRSR